MPGTTLDVKVDRVVDGDTIRVFLKDGDVKSESLRILALDTEEVHAGTKPVTPLGKAASELAKKAIRSGDTVTLIFPGDESIDEALRKHRGNFGRLLVYVGLNDGTDFQDMMIRAGMSPYFTKYGYAHFDELHLRYVDAEREAQQKKLGVWDQVTHNGSEIRNYAALGTWWELRGQIIQRYRHAKKQHPDKLFNTRLDYDELVKRAKAKENVTVFLELRSFKPVSGDHMIFTTGSDAQPFQVFIPNGNSGGGEEIMRLLLTRYVADGEAKPRRSYAYINGPTKMFPDDDTGRPEIVVTNPGQITDWPIL